MSKRFLAAFMAAFMAVCISGAAAFAAPVTKNGGTGWAWISSDEDYGKFYSPANVKTVAQVNDVPTRISAWVKTIFSLSGAAETIENYEISSAVPNPADLSYSLSLVEICPQERTIEYVQETFYNASGTAVWQKIYEPRTVKEINSQSFDEDFYCAVVDHVFRYGEVARKKAEDRWRELWVSVLADKSKVSAIADTTTMRRRGDNLIYWEWRETKDADGNITAVKFQKKTVNLPQGTEKVLSSRDWDAKNGWRDTTGQAGGSYTAIAKGSPQEKGLKILRAYANGYTYWLGRYRTDIKKK